MIRIVIDTNVIISALLFGGKPERVLNYARKGSVGNITSNFILDEVQGVLVGKFSWQLAKVVKAVNWLKLFSDIVYPTKEINIIPYPPDNRILECAIEGHAHFIVSGDRHLKKLEIYKNIKIIDSATFLKIFNPPQNHS